MKKTLIILFAFSLLYSCDEKKSSNSQNDFELQTESEVVENYKKWESIADTIFNRKEFVIFGQKHILELETFILSDSSTVRNSGLGISQVLDPSHKLITDLKLSVDSEKDQKRINKTDFQKILEPKFYKETNLFLTQIDSVIGNKIYLTSDLAVLDSDNQWRVSYSIKIENNRLSEIEVEQKDYIGL